MQADREYCHKCNEETRWLPVRGGKRLKCEKCKDNFPCYYACTHVDCCIARGEGLPDGIEAVDE